MSRPHVRRQGALVGLCGGSGLWSGWPRPDSCRECVAILDAEVAASMAAYAPSPAPPEAPSGGATSAVAGDLRPPMAEQVLALALADVRAVDTLLDAAGITAGPLPDRVRHAIQARDDASAHAADFVRMHGDYVASAQLAHRLLGDAGVPVGLLGERIRAAVAERDAARAEVAKLTAQRNCAREQRDEEGADFERERDRADDLAAEVHTLRELVQCFARLPSVQP
jgi:hypothetical protein